MRIVITAFVLVLLLGAVGCDKNDENTINSLPKTHMVFPAFHVEIDNNYQTFGVDSLRLTVTPDIGWESAVYSDEDGFIGTLASGTFPTGVVDTIITGSDTIFDTLANVYGFNPAQAYNFSFSRTEPFEWIDSFKTTFVVTADSSWKTLTSEFIKLTKVPDPANPPVVALDRVEIIEDPADTVGDQPDSVYDQTLLYGWWLDSAFVISNPDDTVDYPPDSTYTEDVLWGFWTRVDSFFIPPDSMIWCDIDSIIVIVDTLEDNQGNLQLVVDSVNAYSNCDPAMTIIQNRLYRTKGWADFDTVVHFTFPDTLKGLIVTPTGLSIYTWNDTGSGIISDTMPAKIWLIDAVDGDTTDITDLDFDLTMPANEERSQPDYKILIKNE